MTEEKCYFKYVCDTESREGLAYLNKFLVNVKQCRECSGNKDCNCEYRVTLREVKEGGLAKLIKK